MWEILKTTLKGLLASKKVIATVVGLLVALLARIGLPEAVATQVAGAVIGVATVLVGSIGMADLGKEAKKIEAEAKPE